MAQHDHAHRAPESYGASARAYALDLAATAFLFVSVSIMAGRVWRFPFDDEIATLSKIDPDAARALVLSFPATDDIHPPLSYALFCATVVERRARTCRFDRFLRCSASSAAADSALCARAPVPLVVRSRLLAHHRGRRRHRFLLGLLDIHLSHAIGPGRIRKRRGPRRTDRPAWILRR